MKISTKYLIGSYSCYAIVGLFFGTFFMGYKVQDYSSGIVFAFIILMVGGYLNDKGMRHKNGS